MAKASKGLALLVCVLGSAAMASADVEPVDTDYDRKPLSTIVPKYPAKARQERIEGEVQVCFDISREGFPRRIAVRHSTHRYFEKPARDAIRRSTWQPAEPGEKLSGIKACRTFRFTLVPAPPGEPGPASAGPQPRSSGQS